MSWELTVVFAILVLFFLPVKVEGRASFNLLDMKGAIGVFVYRLQVEKQRFRINKGQIFLLTENDTKEEEFDEGKMIFVKMLIDEIKDKTRLKELFVIYNFGIGDAYQTAMIAGHINTLLYCLFSAIKNYKPTASLGVSDNIAFNSTVAQFALTMKISISLYDVVYSLLRSVILTKKQTNKKKEIKGETVYKQ